MERATPGPFAVPDSEHAVVFRLLRQIGLLRAPQRGRGQVLRSIPVGTRSDVVAGVSLHAAARPRYGGGLNTAGYISGYRGSPLGGYDMALDRRSEHLQRHQIVFQPGLNEDLAATTLWGTQQANLTKEAKYDGVFGILVRQRPGVARSRTCLSTPISPGALSTVVYWPVAGDDHANRSSSIPHQSELDFISAMMPMLSPPDRRRSWTLDCMVRFVALFELLGGAQGGG